MEEVINIFKGSQLYRELLESFSSTEKICAPSKESTVISEAIFYHICKMKYAGWEHRIKFERRKKHSIADFFQDLIAFYLKASLPNDYFIILEEKIGKTQPDIAIKKNGKYVFLIEIKTNIGWERPDMDSSNPFGKFTDRIANLSENFSVPKDNIIYIFEEHSNVNKAFSAKYWDKKQGQSTGRTDDYPYSVIYPLFNATDPYYWKHEKGFDPKTSVIHLTDDEIKMKAKANIVSPIEDIIRRISEVN